MLRARAMVCFPGGFGTLDELSDALTLIQTGKAKPMPILPFDERYWRRIVNFDAMVQEGVIVEIAIWSASWRAQRRHGGRSAPITASIRRSRTRS